MLPTPAIPDWSSRNDFKGAFFPAAISTSSSPQLFQLLRIGDRKRWDETEFRRDVLRLQVLYRQHGYYEARIDTTVDRSDDLIDVNFHITEGPPIQVDTLAVTGMDSVPDLNKLLQRLPLTAAAALLLGAIAINFANVVARYLFMSPIYWADEAMVFLVIWSIFLAAAAVTGDGGQLTMDLFSARLSPFARRLLDGAIAAVMVATFAFMAWQAVAVVRILMRNDQRSIALDIPMVVPHAALLVGFVLSTLVVANPAVRSCASSSVVSWCPCGVRARNIGGSSG